MESIGNYKMIPTQNIYELGKKLEDYDGLTLKVFQSDYELGWTYTTADNKIIKLKIYTGVDHHPLNSHQLKDLLQDIELNQISINKVIFATHNRNYCLVPDVFYNPADREKLFCATQRLGENDLVIAEKIKEEPYYFLFSINRAIRDLVYSQWTNVKIAHAVLESLNLYKHENRLGLGKKMLAQIIKNQLNIFVFTDNSFNDVMSVEIETPSDVLYFLMSMANRHKFDISRDVLVLFGDIKRGDNYYQTISAYFQKSYFGNRPDTNSYCEELGILPYQHYFHLYAIE